MVPAERLERVLCFEYVPKTLQDCLRDESQRHEWGKRYQLIQGICQGLRYLHNEQQIIHLDLKPQNILLDGTVPKIADFGVSRFIDGKQSRIITRNVYGTLGYISRECIDKGELSFKADIYSLGIIIIRLLTGSTVSVDLTNWHQSLNTDSPQLRRYIKAAQLCVDGSQQRPTIDNIIDLLEGKETVIKIDCPASRNSLNNPRSSQEQVQSSMVLSAAPPQLQQMNSVPNEEAAARPPLELRFPFERNKRIERPLTLTDRSDHNVAVWIRPTCRHRPEQCLVHIDLHHSIIMDPHSTYAVVATAKEQNQMAKQAHQTCMFEVVMVVVPAADECRITLMSPSKDLKLDDDFFGKVDRFGGEVHWAMVTASVVKDDPGASCPEVRSIHKLITELSEYGEVKCIDVHPTETRILVAYETGYVSILNYETPRQGRVAFQVTRKVSVRSLVPSFYVTSTIVTRTCVIRSAKFVAGGEDWFATGLDDGWVHVYSCATPDMARMEFVAHPGRPVTSLAVHPTGGEPSLLTAADGATSIKLWRWGSDGGWRRAQEFNNPNGGSVQRLTFDGGAFACLSDEGILKVWDIQSPDPMTTVGEATHRMRRGGRRGGRRHEVKVKRKVHADGPRVVKGERE
ncbi:uncharacterized protein C2845_PM17G05320 [Panicum miliaceum]|uniref:non-specific serine/threonine protein kinase n=1 Tax=Panicum miliaceum TaxID=4540 RepID=A0A3L6Q608_PANMI|nr:uncharacterized protein C2845_PM17G05320 [Panicum miliaceum]